MKLAIVTCKNLPQGVEEDQPLFDALTQLKLDYQIHAWDANINWSQYDVCLLRSVWDYHHRIEEFNVWLDKTAQLTQILNKPEVVKWNQNKTYLAELADSGISIAPTQWIKQQQTTKVTTLLPSDDGQTYFLKPSIGADSSDTLRFENNSAGIKQAQAHLDKLLLKQTMMLQPYIKSVETVGETSAIYLSGKYSHAVRKIPVTGDYRVQDSFGATDINHELSTTEMALAEQCLQHLQNKFDQLLYARFDFLHGENGCVYINEVELIEPSLFFNHEKTSAMKMAEAIALTLRTKSQPI